MARYHLAEDTIDQEDIEALISWLQGKPRLTKDGVNNTFEKEWSKWLGRKYSVFCNSGSSANLLMVYALAVSGKLRNKKVIVPSAGWVTTIAPAIQFGLEPIMCEADRDSFGLDLNYLEDLLKKHRPATVILVQVLGVPHKMDRVLELQQKYDFILLEDTCASIGSERKDRKTGTFGNMSSFSFYFGHQMSTIEGGMISTDDREFYNLLVMLRSHGWSKDLDATTQKSLTQKYEIDDYNKPFVFYLPGMNLRSTDLNAFLGLRQLRKLPQTIARRHENHMRYYEHLKDKFQVQKTDDPDATISSIHFCALAESAEQRRAVIKAMAVAGVETRMFTAGNLGLHPFWYERYGKPSFPFADKLYHQGFFLPNHPAHSLETVDLICKKVLAAVTPAKTRH